MKSTTFYIKEVYILLFPAIWETHGAELDIGTNYCMVTNHTQPKMWDESWPCIMYYYGKEIYDPTQVF